MTDEHVVKGNVPAVVTPFRSDGALDLDGFAQLIEWHVSRGVDGLCVAGDNGESWALSFEEKRTLAVEAARVLAGRIPLVVGASASSNRESARLAEMAAEVGAAAVLLMPQTYVLKASTRELVERYAWVAKSVAIPIVFYNSPRRAGIDVTMEQLAAVCDVAPIVAIKESSRDFFHTTHLLERFGSKLAVLIGPCHYILPGVALGAAGCIATGPELLPEDSARRMFTIARARPNGEYRALHHQLTRIYEILMATGTWPSALKAALGLMGLPAGVPREPVLPLDEDATASLRSALRELGVVDGG